MACKTVKETTRIQEKASTEQKTDIVEKVSVKTESNADEQLNQQTNDNQTINEETIIVEWSKPDSVGKQYPIKTIATAKTTNHNKITDTKLSKQEHQQTAATLEKEDKSKLTVNTENKIQTESKPITRSWVKYVGVILSLGLLVLVYLIMKRFKIIK